MRFSFTPREQKAIEFLRQAAEIWPDSLWLFAADGKLNIMEKGKNSEKVITTFGGYDQQYIVAEIDIDTDGGDW